TGVQTCALPIYEIAGSQGSFQGPEVQIGGPAKRSYRKTILSVPGYSLLVAGQDREPKRRVGDPRKVSGKPIDFRISILNCPLSTVHCQLSIVNCQLSTIHYPLSTINYQLSTIHCPLSTVHYQLSTIHYQLSTINYQLSTITYQPSTINY